MARFIRDTLNSGENVVSFRVPSVSTGQQNISFLNCHDRGHKHRSLLVDKFLQLTRTEP